MRTLLTVALFWPGGAPTTHAQRDALNDALPLTETVWRWRSLDKAWENWTQGAAAFLNSLDALARGDVLWLRASTAGLWTQLGAAQEVVPGPAGLNCWDLDGDGRFDPDPEDGDGQATALDCRGDQGEPGLPGEDGESPTVFLTTALVGVQQVENSTTTSFIGQAVVSVECRSGTVLAGGGSSGAPNAEIIVSRPNGNFWVLTAVVNGTPVTLTAYALCATTGILLGGIL